MKRKEFDWVYTKPDKEQYGRECNKKQQRQRGSNLPAAPVDEYVPEIPFLSPSYARYISELKFNAYEVALTLNRPLKDMNRPQKPRAADLLNKSGFLAFSAYYRWEFYNLPKNTGLKFIGPAWVACDHKDIWNAYAHQYSSYARDIDFVTWLESVPKVILDGVQFVLLPECFDPKIFEASAQSPKKKIQHWKFVLYTEDDCPN